MEKLFVLNPCQQRISREKNEFVFFTNKIFEENEAQCFFLKVVR